MEILTSAEGAYIQAAEAMLFSFLSHNPGPHSVYLLSQEDPGRIHDIGRLCELAGASFSHLDPRALVSRMKGARKTINSERSMAMYHRIYAGHLLPPEISKVLYLDADLLVRRSLAPLWEIELGDDYLAASTMSTSFKNADFLAKFGGRYFNSGVMLLNLDRWRRDDVSGECERILAERPQDVTFWDQCLLNFACRPWREIGIEYNYYYGIGPRRAKKFGLTPRKFREIMAQPAVIHFVGPLKPWKKEPADLHGLEREYPLCRQAFERVIADQNWTGVSIQQQQAQARIAERKALRRARRRRSQDEREGADLLSVDHRSAAGKDIAVADSFRWIAALDQVWNTRRLACIKGAMKPLAARLPPPPEPHRVAIARTFPIFGDAAYADQLLSYGDAYRHYEIGGQGFFRAKQSIAVGPHFLVIRGGRLMTASSRGRKSRRTPVLQKTGGRYMIAESATTRQFDHPVIVIGGKASGQFFHWIVEIVPRLEMARASSRKGAPILLRPLIHKYQRETLSILGLEAIEVEEDVISAPQILFPSHMVLPIGKGCISPDLIPLSRRFADAVPDSGEQGERIYISRNDAQQRRVDNEQDVMGLLGAYGFRLVRLSELSLAEQVSLFRSADAVVGPHGAGLVSTLYCRPGTKVIELWPAGFRHVSPFWNIASLAGLNYAMCICSAGLDATGQFDGRGMTVNLALLEAAIRAQDTRPSMDGTRSGPHRWLRGLRLFPTRALREGLSRGKRGGVSIDGSSRRGRG